MLVRSLLTGLVALSLGVTNIHAQVNDNSGAAQRPGFTDKLDQFRRSLLGGPSQPEAMQTESAPQAGPSLPRYGNPATQPTPRTASRPLPVGSPGVPPQMIPRADHGVPSNTARAQQPQASQAANHHQSSGTAPSTPGMVPQNAATPQGHAMQPQGQAMQPQRAVPRGPTIANDIAPPRTGSTPVVAPPQRTLGSSNASSFSPPESSRRVASDELRPTPHTPSQTTSGLSTSAAAAAHNEHVPANNLRSANLESSGVSSATDRVIESHSAELSDSVSSRVPQTPRRVAPANPLAAQGREQPSRSTDDGRVLLSRRSPILSVEAIGPQKITIGKEAAYSVRVLNSGDLAANDVVVHVAIPVFAEVTEARGTLGSAGLNSDGSGGLQWRISVLEGQREAELSLKLIPRKSEGFELGLRHTYTPTTSTAKVEVQEPRLQMAVTGAREVVFGQKHTYKLTIANPGNGDAENVVIHLLPITPGDGAAASHRIGTLAAGETQAIEIELTARQAGRISVRTEATADGGLRAEASEEVYVRRAGLEVDVAAPRMHYAGTPLTYVVRVKNPGDASADEVQVSVSIPADAEVLSVTQGGERAPGSRQVQWSLGQLLPGAEQMLEIKCILRSGGEGRVEAAALAAGDLRASQLATTNVLALADLVLDVSDPPGPVPVGQEIVYELRIRNRGTSAAEQVEMVAFFSEGIEPAGVEGGAHELSPGTVVFRNMPAVPAGSELVYKIKANASTPGNHRIRVELQCPDLGTRLTQEDSTLFYADEPAVLNASRPASVR